MCVCVCGGGGLVLGEVRGGWMGWAQPPQREVPRDTIGASTEDDSVNTIQETPNSKFRLFLSETPCMACTNSIISPLTVALPPTIYPYIHLK